MRLPSLKNMVLNVRRLAKTYPKCLSGVMATVLWISVATFMCYIGGMLNHVWFGWFVIVWLIVFALLFARMATSGYKDDNLKILKRAGLYETAEFKTRKA